MGWLRQILSRDKASPSTSDPHNEFPDATFSPSAVSAMNVALDVAYEFWHEYLSSQHLLLAFWRVIGCDAHRALVHYAVTENEVRDAIEQAEGMGLDLQTRPHLNRLKEHRQVIALAVEEAQRRQSSDVTTGHLLWAMLASSCDGRWRLEEVDVPTDDLFLRLARNTSQESPDA